MRYKVGIIDSDIEYMQDIMEFVNANNYPIRLVGFSSVISVEEYIAENRLELLLLGVEIEEVTIDIPVMYLTDNRDYIDSSAYVFKYQKVDKILDSVVSYIREQKVIYDKSHTHLMCAVYSPLGRCGKTNFAKALCSYYKESLYVGFEEYCSIDNLDDDTCRLSEDFLYYLAGRNDKIFELIKLHNEVFGNRNYLDIRQLGRLNIEWFKEQFIKQDRFKRIVFDIGVGALNDIGILSAMDKIYVPVLKDKTSVNKINVFKKMMKEEANSQIEKNIIYIALPNVNYDDEQMKAIIEGGHI